VYAEKMASELDLDTSPVASPQYNGLARATIERDNAKLIDTIALARTLVKIAFIIARKEIM